MYVFDIDTKWRKRLIWNDNISFGNCQNCAESDDEVDAQNKNVEN